MVMAPFGETVMMMAPFGEMLMMMTPFGENADDDGWIRLDCIHYGCIPAAEQWRNQLWHAEPRIWKEVLGVKRKEKS